jgi:glycosyltransferase involved in cell wall biosynthesis
MVSHDASRTGAPTVAASFVRWLAARGDREVRVVLLRGGPLASRFAAAAPTVEVPSVAGRALRAGAGLAARPWLEAAARRADAPPVVVASSVAAWRAAAAIRRRRALVCWVHELDGVADQLVPDGSRAALIAQTDRFVAAGAPVGRMLVERWGIDPALVRVVDPFVDAPSSDPASSERGAALGPTRPPRLLAAGSMVARKAPDAFVAVLANLHTPLEPGDAAWLGGPLDGPMAQLVRHDLARTGLDRVVSLPGEAADLWRWWPRDGIVVHLAREDPAPLVVLEAALRRVPVVTWDSGGAAELLRAAGLGDLVAPTGDLLGAADRIDALLADPDRRAAAGVALSRVAERRTTPELAPALLAAIERAS